MILRRRSTSAADCHGRQLDGPYAEEARARVGEQTRDCIHRDASEDAVREADKEVRRGRGTMHTDAHNGQRLGGGAQGLEGGDEIES